MPLGGPSIVVDPNGELLVETLYPIAVATIDEDILGSARTGA